jgi:anaerobic magnesium-protoporphyrin IX monomethyl ester cyclase
VLDEMEELCRGHGIRELHLIDDCFNFSADRALAILNGIGERGLDLRLAFPNGIRGDRLPDELLDTMKLAGVYKINIGIESGSPRVQKTIRKGLSLDAIRDGIARAAARGIFTHGFFMMGFPDETEDDLNQTIEFARRSDLHTAGFALLSPFPGTEVYRMAVAAGKKVEFDPDDSSYSRLAVNLTAVDDQTLLRMHRRAHWKFYGSPKRLWRIALTMPHPSDIIKVGMKHFRLKFL